MDLETLHKKILEHCKNAGYSQKALANELGLHTSTLSRKFNLGNEANQLTQAEVKQIVQILANWRAIYTREQAEEILQLGGLGAASLNWERAPFNLLEKSALTPVKTPNLKVTLPEVAPETIVYPQTAPEIKVQSATTPNHNLPAFITPLVGREKELNQLSNLLIRSSTRLVTLSGIGGVGKTRLATQVGYRLLEDFEHGVCFVELAAIQEASQLPATLARACGLPELEGKKKLENSEGEVFQQLKNHLRHRRQLFILDNFEQLTTNSQAALLIAKLLSEAPGVKFVVTSRILLKIYGEYEFRVLPLTLPSEQTENLSLEKLSQQEAIALFVQRAQAANPRFSLTEENKSSIVQICRRLEGMPLALELAAARLRLFTPKLLLEKLNQSFSLLSGGALDMPSRHQTVRAAIEWSYRLLSEPEKVLFRRLAIFENGATLEAIMAVTDFSQPLENYNLPLAQPSALDPLEGVSSLVEKSILQQVETFTGSPGADNQPQEAEIRFTLLEMLREFAREELQKEPTEAEILKHRYAAYYTQMVAQADSEIRKNQQDFWISRLQYDYANIQSTLQWATQSEQPFPTIALKLSTALLNFWQLRGLFSEGIEWLEKALACAEQLESVEVADALGAASRLYITRRDFETTDQYLQRALKITQAYPNSLVLAKTLFYQALTCYFQGNYPTSRELFKESLRLAKQLKSEVLIASILNAYCQVEIKTSNHQEAAEMAEELYNHSRKLGDKFSLSDALYLKADMAYAHNDYPTVYKLCQESLALLKHTPDQLKQAKHMVLLALVCEEQSRYAEARPYFEKCRDLYEELGSLRNYVASLHNLARLEGAAGYLPTAFEKFKDIIKRWQELKDNNGAAMAMYCTAEIAIFMGNYAAARHYTEQSLTLRKQLGDKRNVNLNFYQLARLERAQGNYAAAYQLVQEALAVTQALQAREPSARLLHELSQLYRLQERFAEAQANLEEVLQLARELAIPKQEIAALLGLGELHTIQGNYELAGTYLLEALQIARNLNHKQSLAETLQLLGYLKTKQATASSNQTYSSQAKSYWRESWLLCAEIGLQERLPEFTTGLVELLLRSGRIESAIQVAGYCHHLQNIQQSQLELIPYRSDYEKNLQELKALVPSEAYFSNNFNIGQKLSLPEVIELTNG